MKWRLLVRPEAEAEILAAHDWYQLRAHGLGAEFLRALEAVFAAIERDPQSYAVVHGEARRALLRRFPYAIFFIVEKKEIDSGEAVEKITVLACFHTRRDLQTWQQGTEI